ncbi:MAG TPA: hypothetical protein VEG62_04635, partial [Acidimicrobiales bacterium]|nr:hypothetical protein [Acidimicrobiales bacterium]
MSTGNLEPGNLTPIGAAPATAKKRTSGPQHAATRRGRLARTVGEMTPKVKVLAAVLGILVAGVG